MRNTARSGLSAVALFTAAVAVAGCTSTTGGSGSSSAPSASALGAGALKGKGLVTINYWDEMSGTNGTELRKLINTFNQQNKGRVKVNPVFKGTYQQGLAAYTAASKQQRPDLLQMNDVTTRYLIDSKTTIPVQTFINADHYSVKGLVPNIAGYYEVNNQLDSMPFNASMPLLYINKEAFQKAGLDPNKPPTTYAEIEADSKKIQSTPGETVKFGFAMTQNGWYGEQESALANQLYCNADNGRTGRADKVSLDNPTMVGMLGGLQKMVKDGVAMKLDSTQDTGDNAFTSGETAMIVESSAEVSSLTGAAAKSKNHFTALTGFFPRVEAGNGGGAVPGGASNWVINSGNTAKERAAWEFAKFLDSTDSQVSFATATGYFPGTEQSLSDPREKKFVKDNPAFATAIDELTKTPVNHDTQGCSLGVMSQEREAFLNAWSAVVLQGKDPKTTLAATQKQVDSMISDYDAKLG